MSARRYEWRGGFESSELESLRAGAFRARATPNDWRRQVEAHSVGWVTAREDADLVGFVNVAWDGGEHAFILDTCVHPARQRQGIGKALVDLAAREARSAGCAWLHVDFEGELASFYRDGCGFEPSVAGVLQLRPLPPEPSGVRGHGGSRITPAAVPSSTHVFHGRGLQPGVSWQTLRAGSDDSAGAQEEPPRG